MHEMMNGTGWSMRVFHWLGVAVLVLAVAALVKFVFFR
jgi:hypothetical protein